jgi:hypothetical protein
VFLHVVRGSVEDAERSKAMRCEAESSDHESQYENIASMESEDSDNPLARVISAVGKLRPSLYVRINSYRRPFSGSTSQLRYSFSKQMTLLQCRAPTKRKYQFALNLWLVKVGELRYVGKI